jgi:hypothetical protein
MGNRLGVAARAAHARLTGNEANPVHPKLKKPVAKGSGLFSHRMYSKKIVSVFPDATFC